jgi:O-methyltransferase
VRAIESVYDLVPAIDDHPLRRRSSFPELTDEVFWDEYERAKPFSMLHVTGFWNLFEAVRTVVENRVPGDVVECGCLFGGCSIFVRRRLDQLGARDRMLHVFDTFEGFPDGSFDSKGGVIGIGPRYQDFSDIVAANLASQARSDGVTLHQGMVEDTLVDFAVGPLALVRLDTDFYDSTRVELEVLYPALSPGGALIIDDYGIYDGARRATDEYFAAHGPRPLLVRVDKGVVAGSKPA